MAKPTSHLTRRSALGLIGAGVCAASPVAAQARLAYELVPKQVANGVWMIEGSTDYFSRENGGAIVNCVMLKGETGLILIDSGPSRRYGEALSLALRKLDFRGVSAVVNTHHHPDHFLGNQVFADRPMLALGPTTLLQGIHGDGFADNMYRILGDWMRGTESVPANTNIGGSDLVIDGRRFASLPLSGHTEADLVLLDQETGIVIGGDILFLDRAPTTPNADIEEWLHALDAVEQIGGAAFIPGHGPLDPDGRSIAQTRAYLIWLHETLTGAAREGLDMVEAMDLPMPPEFRAMGAQPEEYVRTVSHLFPEIEMQVLPRAN